jgi:hypothetical protein
MLPPASVTQGSLHGFIDCHRRFEPGLEAPRGDPGLAHPENERG